MPRLVINSEGLGDATTVTQSSGLAPSLNDPAWQAQCGQNFGTYLTDPWCWGDSWSNWQNAYMLSPSGGLTVTTPVTVGAPASGLTDPNAVLGDTTGATSQDLSNAAIAATQANNAGANPPDANSLGDSCTALSANWPYPFDSLNCTEMMAIGGVTLAVLMFLLGGRR